MTRVKSNLTRVLHLALLAIVLHQLFGSAFVTRPLPGDDPELAFVMHVWTGVAGLQVLVGFWLWTIVRERRETPFSHLVPWLFPSRIAALIRETASVLIEIGDRRWPSLDRPAIVGAVHGLGLLLATGVATSGALWYFVLDGTFAGRVVLLAHKAGGDLMWVYLVAHATMALLHHAMGEDTLVKMFGFRPRRARTAGPVRAR